MKYFTLSLLILLVAGLFSPKAMSADQSQGPQMPVWMDQATGQSWYLVEPLIDSREKDNICVNLGLREPVEAEWANVRPRLMTSPLWSQLPVATYHESDPLTGMCDDFYNSKLVYVHMQIVQRPPNSSPIWTMLYDITKNFMYKDTLQNHYFVYIGCELKASLLCVSP